MKSIHKLKKIGKITAGSALLVGATLTGAAGLASAANHDTDLGDYPAPFVGEDGQIQSTIVVGESAKTVDVVGAVNIAGSLGQDAYSTETQTVSGSGGSFSASSGVTLDTANDDLYFGDNVNAVRETLTQNDLDILAETTFRDDGGTDYDVTNYLNVGNEQVSFGNSVDKLDNEDPELHVTVPAESDVDQNSYLVNLQANMDEIDFTDSDVKGEDIELFGKEFTVSENDNADTDSELVLFGSSEETELATGESETITVDGEEVTLEVVSVDSSAAGGGDSSITVDGRTESYSETDTFTPTGSDTEIRIDDLVNQGATDDGNGIVRFQVGSEELVLSHGNQIEDGDGDDVEGTYVEFNGGDGLDSNELQNGVSSIDIYLGSEDDDEDALVAGESWSHSLFEDVEFHFNGLNPDSAEDGEEVTVGPSEDETLDVSFTAGGDSTSVEFFNYDGSNNNLADSDGDKIVAVEGDAVQEDEYVVTDAGDFSHLWEVTSVDVDTTNPSSNGNSGDEATVELQDAVSGASVELDLDINGDGNGVNNDDVYEGEEVIDGQTYHATLDTNDKSDTSKHDLKLTWGTDADFGATGSGSSGVTTAFPTVKTDSGARVGFYDPGQDDFGSIGIGTSLASFNSVTDYAFVNDGGNDGDATAGYQDGDEVFSVTTAHDASGSDLTDGEEVRTFQSNEKYIDPSGGSIGSDQPIILDDGDGNLEASTTDTVKRDGSAGVLTSLSTVGALGHYEDASGTDAGDGGSANADYDSDGAGGYGEAIYDESSGTTADQVDASDTRITSITVNSGSDDSDVSTIDLGLNTNDAVASSDNDADLSTTIVNGAGSNIQTQIGVVDTNPSAGLQSDDNIILDVSGNGQYDEGTDVVLHNGANALNDGDGFHENLTGAWYEGEETSGSSTEIAIFDVGNNEANADIDLWIGDGGNSAVTDVDGDTDVTIGSGAPTDPVRYVDIDGSTSNLDSDDSIYVELGTAGTVSYGADIEDIRVRGFTAAYSADTDVASTDLDTGVVLEQFETNDRFLNGNQANDYENQEAIIQSSDDNYGSGDTVKVNGVDNNAFQSFNTGNANLDVYVDDNTDTNTYDGNSEDIITLSRFTTTSGTQLSVSADSSVNLNQFASNVKYDDSEGDTTYDDDESIVDDSGSTTDVYDSADTILYGSTGANIQYWSSDSSETSGVSGLQSILPASDPGLVVIEDEADDDLQESYTVSATWDGTDEELTIDSPSFSDGTKRQSQTLESDDDVTASYDQYGVYTEYNNDEQGSFTLNVPAGQSTAGAAVTGNDGGLSASGGSGSVEVNTPVGFPDSAALDSDSGIDSAKENDNMILVGGPAVNSLTQELADSGDSWTADQYSEGEGLIQLVNGAFAEGKDALVVAGYSGEDTRQAANYLANYADHSDDLSGQDQVTVSTQ